MYVYACLLHAHEYSKYAYAYNWAAYAGPIYVHAYSCPETLIRTFWLLFLCFICLICLYSILVFYMCMSLSPCLFIVCSLDDRLGFSFNLVDVQ